MFLKRQDNEEIRQTISELHKSNPPSYIHRKVGNLQWEL